MYKKGGKIDKKFGNRSDRPVVRADLLTFTLQHKWMAGVCAKTLSLFPDANRIVLPNVHFQWEWGSKRAALDTQMNSKSKLYWLSMGYEIFYVWWKYGSICWKCRKYLHFLVILLNFCWLPFTFQFLCALSFAYCTCSVIGYWLVIGYAPIQSVWHGLVMHVSWWDNCLSILFKCKLFLSFWWWASPSYFAAVTHGTSEAKTGLFSLSYEETLHLWYILVVTKYLYLKHEWQWKWPIR